MDLKSSIMTPGIDATINLPVSTAEIISVLFIYSINNRRECEAAFTPSEGRVFCSSQALFRQTQPAETACVENL